jgi:type VI secretion system secreted protein VgrG
VKVHFPWDRLQPKDDRCSHWVPVLQENTGSSSAHPRVGWEVMCQFLEGDPDRPVVIGRVYNPDDTFPELLPELKMVTSLRSLSSPTRKGHNHIRIDDTAGGESIHMHSEKDQNVVVGNDKREETLDSESSTVRRDELIRIGAKQTIQVDRGMLPVVAGSQVLSVGGSRTTDVQKSQSEDVKKDRELTIGGGYTRRAGETDSVTVKKNLKETIGGLALEGTVKTNSTTAQRLSAVLVGGALIELALKSKTETAGKARAEAVGILSFTKTKDRIATRVVKSRLTAIGGTLKVEALKRAVVTGLEKLEMKAGTFTLQGDEKLTLKVGKTEVVLAEGHLVMKAEETIRFETKAESKQGTKTSTQI